MNTKYMLIEEAEILLEPGYSSMETGYYRLPNGYMHVRTLTRMPHCKGKMIDWWFGYIKDTETYKMWHPTHQFFKWDGKWSPGHYVGASHITHEYLGAELVKMRISFIDPAEIFDTSKFEAANVGAVICGHIFDMNDAPAGCHIHFLRDTDYGCDMRNRFWLFEATEAKTLGLMTHNLLEMGNLAEFLPNLYAKHNPIK